jgi:hypothetical protein
MLRNSENRIGNALRFSHKLHQVKYDFEHHLSIAPPRLLRTLFGTMDFAIIIIAPTYTSLFTV